MAADNFHGRTTTIVSFSTDPLAREGFGPFTPGFRTVPYGDAAAMRDAIDDDTVAVLIEPIQGEAGVIIPPAGYLAAIRELCTELNVLFVADEIQSGLGRTGTTFACELEGVVPDVYVLGKALGGGIVPVSAVVSSDEVLSVMHPGNHGSTFGGNPLAAAVGRAVVQLLESGEIQARARDLAGVLETGLRKFVGAGVVEVRTRGLWAGIDVEPAPDERPGVLRADAGQGCARQGHPRVHHPAGPTAGHRAGRPRVDGGPDGCRARRGALTARQEASSMEARPLVPPFSRDDAIQKVRAAEDRWNTRDPERGPRPGDHSGLSDLDLRATVPTSASPAKRCDVLPLDLP